jgi:OOP family OmpA-OmpF porin
VAERTKPVAIPAPVAEIVEAWNERSADRFAAALADDVRIDVPPLHLQLQGRDDAWDGVARLFGAFGALRYTSRHRYLGSDAVTDEALLEGLQTRDFLGAPPSGQPGTVAARVMMRHDGRLITSLTVWPDVSALRDLSAGVARRIDLRAGAGAASMVASLRATLPSTEAKLSVAHSRALPTTLLPEESAALLPGAPEVEPAGTPAKEAKGGRGKPSPKAPIPRKARRRRAILAGLLMLALAGVLVAYVVQGVQGTKEVVAVKPKPAPTAKASATPTTTSSPSTSPSPTASNKPLYNENTRTYTFPNKVLFEVNQATLRPNAQQALDEVIAALVAANRVGRITVTGHTDPTGSDAGNKKLSLQRAQAVKRYLTANLPKNGGWTIAAFGRGSEKPVNDNSTELEREANRRVEIQVPPDMKK